MRINRLPAVALLGVAVVVAAVGLAALEKRDSDGGSSGDGPCDEVRTARELDRALQAQLNEAERLFFDSEGAIRDLAPTADELADYQARIGDIREGVLEPLLAAYADWEQQGPHDDSADVAMQAEFAESRWSISASLTSGADLFPALDRLSPRPSLVAGALSRLAPPVEEECGFRV